MPAMTAQTRRIGTCVIGVFAAAWLGTVLFGQRVMMNYDYTTGAAATPPAKWPQHSAIPRTEGLATVVLVAHPKSPRTRASLEELALNLARFLPPASPP